MTNPQDTNLKPANATGHPQERARFRVELSAQAHQALREAASEDGKHMRVLAEEIFEAYFEQRRFRSQPGGEASLNQDESPPNDLTHS